MSESFPNVEVSIFSSISPLLRTAAPEPTHDYWSIALEYDALPWRWGCNRPDYCVSQHHVLMEESYLHYICRRQHRSENPQSRAEQSDFFCRPPMRWRKATSQCQVPRRVLPIRWVYLDRDVSTEEILHRTRYTEGVDQVGNGHIWRQEWEHIFGFTSYLRHARH